MPARVQESACKHKSPCNVWPCVKTQIVPPVNIPIRTKIGSKMDGAPIPLVLNPVPLVNIKIGGTWVFIRPRMGSALVLTHSLRHPSPCSKVPRHAPFQIPQFKDMDTIQLLQNTTEAQPPGILGRTSRRKNKSDKRARPGGSACKTLATRRVRASAGWPRSRPTSGFRAPDVVTCAWRSGCYRMPWDSGASFVECNSTSSSL